MRKSALLIICLYTFYFASSQIVVDIPKISIQIKETRERIQIDHSKYLDLLKNSGPRSQFVLSFILKGEKSEFIAERNEVVDFAAQNELDGISTFDLISLDHPESKFGSLTLGNESLYATIFENGDIISIYPEDWGKSNWYVVEYGTQPDLPKPNQTCGHDHDQIKKHGFHPPTKERATRAGFTIGSKRFNYRVAIVVTGEFYQKNGNNDTDVNMVVVNTVNALSAIFNNEMSFRLSIGSRIFRYMDPATDPFIPDETGGEGRTIQAGKVLPMHFNSSLFDIGHVFHQHEDGDGWSSGGVAALQSVCDGFVLPSGQLFKASAWSGSYSNVGNSWINLAAHEFGHQFGANHTFNGIGESCTTAIAQNTSFEIGSGTTIMSYNGICNSDQNIPSSGEIDNYFHNKSLEEMFEYVYNGEGGTCGNPTATSNQLPTVTANPCDAKFNMPKGTPFYLMAKGTFTDNDIHTYCWEQVDEDGAGIKPTHGFIGTDAANSKTAPLFRSYPPSKDAERYFPSLAILTGAGSSPFEVLPEVDRELNFNITLRDNNSGGGAVSTDNIKISVSNTGPFVLQIPNSGTVFKAGQNEKIVWKTNQSNDLCTFVRIKMSIDGGLTFPIVVAEKVLYASGEYFYDIPSTFLGTTKAKIMLECMDYDCFKFFTISAGNFTITSDCNAEYNVICPTNKVSQDEGSASLNLSMNKVIGEKLGAVQRSVNADLTPGNVAVIGEGNMGCEVVSNFYYYNRVNIFVTQSGTYNFSIGGSGFVSFFRASTFIPTFACSSFITSSAVSNGDGSISRSATMTAQLSQCTEYVVVFYSFSELPVDISLTQTSGPGIIMEKITDPSPAYQNIYILVNDNSGLITYAGQSTDFRTTPSGNYTLYAMSLSANFNISSLPGTLYSELKSRLCINESLNSRKIEILAACKISELKAGQQSVCVASTNFFTQDIIVVYDKAPANGQLSVNGQLFNITSSPQTVTLTDLDANGLSNNVTAFFTATPNCALQKNNLFTAPIDCCPIIVELGPDINKCQGDGTVKLEAGDNSNTYLWSKDGQILTTSEGGILFVVSSGLYKVKITHVSGCVKTDSIRVTFHQAPSVVLADNQTFCNGETYTLSTNSSGAQTFQWFKNDILINGELSKDIQITESGTYKVIAISDFNCKGEDETFVGVVNPPVVELGPDQKKCDGETLMLNAGNEGVKYEWYKDGVLLSGALANTYGVVQSGNYSVIVTNAAQCRNQDQIKVDFFSSPLVEDLPSLINVCQGNSANISVTASDYQTLQWYYDGNIITGSNGLSLVANNSGIYAVEATNLAGCKTRRTTQVEVRSLPVVQLGSDIVSCIGSSVTLNAGSEGTSYVWQKDNINLPVTSNSFEISQNGIYKVSVTNQYNCTTEDEIMVSFVSGPSIELNGDKTICEGTNHFISITTAAVNPEIKWYKDAELIPGENGLFLSVSLAGVYEVIVKAGTPACEIRKSVKISVDPRPAFNLGNDRSICEGEAFPILNAGAGNTSFSWTFNGTPLATTQTIAADKTGIYGVTVKNSFNCERTEQVKITISPLPTLVLQDQYSLCDGTDLMVNAETNGTKFEWKRNNVTISNAVSKNITLDTEGTYLLVVSNDVNCRIEKSFIVTARPAPQLDLGIDTTLCPNESTELNPGLHTSYKWSDNTTNSTLIVHAGSPSSVSTTLYKVTVTNAFGCTNKDSAAITVLPVVVATIMADKPGICNGDPVKLTAGGGTKYIWTDPDGNTLSTLTDAITVASPTKTTTYTVGVSDGVCANNISSKTIEIKVFEPSNISAGADTCIIKGRSIKLNASGGVNYQWNNVDLIEGPSNISNPTVKPMVETIFTATITDKNGCEFSDEVKICVKEDTFKPISIITPNGDGKNDELIFGGLEDFPQNTLKIFNRWGNLIFEADGYQVRGELFNGLRNGEKLPADTYYYVLTYDNQVIKSALTILWE